jgi:hypothetical protein
MSRLPFSSLAMFIACTLGGVAATAAQTDVADAQARYQAERAACLSGRSHQERDTCLREAGAALAEARRGRVAGAVDYRQNALVRCQALPENDRADCRARVNGEGARSGSVEGGGVYKESVTRTTTPPESPKPAAP